MKAAANPAKSDVYYFVVKPGSCNEHTFTASSDEFDQLSAEYQAALEEQGGSPTEC
jgi:cell division protein YceG involved in septum cleavage